MKQSNLLLLGGLLITVSLLSTSCTTIDASHEGIQISKIGSDRGANDIEKVTGWVFYNPLTSFIEEYPTFTQKKDYDPFKVSTQDGSVFTIDPTLNYAMVKGQGANVYRKYRKELPEIEDNIIRVCVYNAYRDVANAYTADSLMRKRSVFEARVETALAQVLLKDGFIVSGLTSNLTPPASLQAGIDAKNNTIQNSARLVNLIQSEKASQEIAITRANGEATATLVRARAEAEANRLKQQSLTPLLIQQQWITKWNGDVPTTQLGAGTNTFYGIK